MTKFKIIKAPKNCYVTFKDENYEGGFFYEKVIYMIYVKNKKDRTIDFLPITLDEINDLLISIDNCLVNKSDYNSIITLDKKPVNKEIINP